MRTNVTTLLLVALLVVEACGGGAQTSGHQPEAVLNCSLPVTYTQGLGGYYPVHSGLIHFPDGSFTPSPDSGFTYDWAHKLWLQVGRMAISPDGSSYVDIKQSDLRPASIHVVDIASKADREIWRDDGSFEPRSGPRLLGYSARGIFVGKFGEVPTVWNINPKDTAPTLQRLEIVQQPPDVFWGAAGPDAIWGSSRSQGGLLRFDLTTGKVALWLKDKIVRLVGFGEAGLPIVVVTDIHIGQVNSGPTVVQTQKVVKVVGPNRKVELADVSSVHMAQIISPVLDGHGIWFGDRGGYVYFVPRGGQVRKAATVTSAQNMVFLVSGFCM